MCVPVHVDPTAITTQAGTMKAIADGFATHRTLDSDAPDDPVMVRILGVAKSGACTPDEEAPESSLTSPVVGCAYSCPTVLSANHGVLTVDFDLPGGKCTDVALTDCVTFGGADAGAP